jgi:hypothetical protein
MRIVFIYQMVKDSDDERVLLPMNMKRGNKRFFVNVRIRRRQWELI